MTYLSLTLFVTNVQRLGLMFGFTTLPDRITYPCLLHITREFYSIKLICRNLYALFSHMKKAYTANQNGVQLFHVSKFNQSMIA